MKGLIFMKKLFIKLASLVASAFLMLTNFSSLVHAIDGTILVGTEEMMILRHPQPQRSSLIIKLLMVKNAVNQPQSMLWH